MREKKFTPGPWEVHKGMNSCVTFTGEHGEENLFMSNAQGYFSCQSKHDAHLIAAAPELLRELESARHALKTLSEEFGFKVTAHISEIDKVLAKAYGDES